MSRMARNSVRYTAAGVVSSISRSSSAARRARSGSVGGHLVERLGERSELVARANGDTRREIAGRQLPHAVVERRQMARHAMRNRHDADDGEADDQEPERQT